MQSVVFSWLLAAAQPWDALLTPAASSDKSCLSDKSTVALGWRGRWLFQTLDSFCWDGFPTPFVAAQYLKRVFQAGIWPWEVRVKVSRSSLVRRHRGGEDKWAAKSPGEFSVQQGPWCSCHRHWWPTQYIPSVVLLGMGALEDALGSCGSQRPLCTDFQKHKNFWFFWSWPADHGPGVVGGKSPIVLGREQHGGGSKEHYKWHSLSSTCMFILENLKELWICWVCIRLGWRTQEQWSLLWQAIYYGWLASLESECDYSFCLLLQG